jgi:hypothetical protein
MYALTANQYFRNDSINSLNHNASLSSESVIGPVSTLNLSAGAGYGRFTPLTLNNLEPETTQIGGPGPGNIPTPGEQAPNTVAGARPDGDWRFLSTHMHQGFQTELSPPWRLNQSLAIGHFRLLDETLNQPPTTTFSGAINVARPFGRDSATGTLQVGHLLADPIYREDILVVRRRERSFAQLLFGWQRELNPLWTVQAEAGALAAIDLRFMRAIVGPSARLAIRWADLFQYASFEVAHTIMPSIFLAETLIIDRAVLQAGLALNRRETVLLGALTSVSHGRAMTPRAELAGTLNVFLAQAALTYAPRAHPISLSLTASHRTQDANIDATTSRALPSYSQNLIMLSATVIYPRIGQAAASR